MKMVTEKIQNQSFFKTEQAKQWFDELITTIKAHQNLLTLNFVSPETKKFYEILIKGSENEILKLSREATSSAFIKQMLLKYISELSEYQNKPIELAVDYNNSQLLVWAVINDDDDEAENALILSAAKVNAQYYNYGFNVSSSIIEKSDRINKPEHYQSILN